MISWMEQKLINRLTNALPCNTMNYASKLHCRKCLVAKPTYRRSICTTSLLYTQNNFLYTKGVSLEFQFCLKNFFYEIHFSKLLMLSHLSPVSLLWYNYLYLYSFLFIYLEASVNVLEKRQLEFLENPPISVSKK